MKEVIGVQYLRGFAALAVVFYHALQSVTGVQEKETFWQALGSGGVDVFFVISGFIIWTSTSRSSVTPGEWWLSRLIRIVPLYWLALVAAYLKTGLETGFDPGAMPRLVETAKAFLFVFTQNSQTGDFTPYFVPGWSLNYEFFFYAIVGLTLFSRKPMLRLAIIIATFVLLAGLRHWADKTDPVQFRYTSPLQMEFIAGVLIAVVYPRLRELRHAWIIGLASVAAAMLVMGLVSPRLYPDGPRFIYFGMPAVLLVFGGLMLEGLLQRRPIAPLKLLGDASYSLYLVHTLVLSLPGLVGISEWLAHTMPLAALVFELGVAVAAAIAVFKLVERPLLSALRKRTQAPRMGSQPRLAVLGGASVAFVAMLVLELLTPNAPLGNKAHAAERATSALAITPASPVAPAAAYTVETLIDDMTKPNTDGMFPAHGPVTSPERAGRPNQWGADVDGDPQTGSYAYVDTKIRLRDKGPSGRGWNPYRGRSSLAEHGVAPDEVVRRFPWVVVGDAWQLRNTSSNTRVQVRNVRHQVLTLDGKWLDAGSSTLSVAPNTYGSWHSIWLGPGMASGNGLGYATDIGTGTSLSDGRIEPDGGSSLGSIGMGRRPVAVDTGVSTKLEYYNTFVWHFYPLPGFDRSLRDWESTIAGTAFCVEARLTLHSTAATDDRDRSAMLLNMGADYYNVTRKQAYLAASMHSRWKRVTRDWQVFCVTDITAPELRANPPPGFVASSASK